MYYPEELVEEVRTRNDIVPVISQYVKLTKKGSGYFGCCPFHNEKTPSFHVSPSRQTYHCFGCGVGGNVISFVMEYENYSFQEALKALANRVGMTLPEREATEEEKQRASLRSRLLEANKEAARYYVYQLRSPQGARAKEYFQRRGLSEETLRKFGLGYSQMYRDDLYRYLKKKNFSDSEIAQTGLVKLTEKGVRELFWNRAMFPIMDAGSRVIGFGGRVMGDGEPKYLNSPETLLFDKGRNLYGLHLARRSRRPFFLICEGYMDVIAMHQAGFDCAVASLGTALTTGHAVLIRRYVKEVILTYDSDGAGVKAAMRAIPLLKEAGLSVRVLNLKPYKDPDEFMVHEGAEAFEERIRGAVNAFLFESDVLAGQFDMRNPEQKTAFHREIASRLTAFPDELERNNYLEAVSERHRIPADALREMVRRIGASAGEEGRAVIPPMQERRRERVPRSRTEGLLLAERLVLNWALSGKRNGERLMEYLQPEDFSDEICRALAEEAFSVWRSGREPEPAALMNRYAEEEEARNRVSAVLTTELPEEAGEEERERILSESVRRIRKHSLDQMARCEKDPKRLQEIIMEKAKIERRKISLLG